MLHKVQILAIAALSLLVTPLATMAAPPLRVDQAAMIAQQHLQERGLTDSIHVRVLGLEADSLARGTQYWYARWSRSIPQEERKVELGLRINMDGSLVKMVEGPSTNSLTRHHRTRSDKPSILDLK